MRRMAVALVALVGIFGACDDSNDDSAESAKSGSAASESDAEVSLTVYSGREEELVGPLLDRYEEESGVKLDVRYGETAELAAQILEEGDNSPADVYFAQDAGALGALQKEERLAVLPEDLLDLVPERFRSGAGVWVGTSGRARTVVYNTEALTEDDLPASILDFTDPKWKGKVGWAPTNASFQAFVTALRKVEGDEVARDWLEGVKANAEVYPKNTPIVEAVASGEIEVGFVNHYYLYRVKAENPDAKAENYFLPGGDPGALVNVAGAAVLETSEAKDAAADFIRFLLSKDAQTYFAGEAEDDGYEYPLIDGVAPPVGLPALGDIEQPDVDLADLDDLEGTLALLQEVGLV